MPSDPWFCLFHSEFYNKTIQEYGHPSSNKCRKSVDPNILEGTREPNSKRLGWKGRIHLQFGRPALWWRGKNRKMWENVERLGRV